MILPGTKFISDCCDEDIKLESAEEGTSFYSCTKCKKPCDFYTTF